MPEPSDVGRLLPTIDLGTSSPKEVANVLDLLELKCREPLMCWMCAPQRVFDAQRPSPNGIHGAANGRSPIS